MSKKKSKHNSEPERDYYKLKTDAVNRLVEADKGNVRKVADEEIESITVPSSARFLYGSRLCSSNSGLRVPFAFSFTGV